MEGKSAIDWVKLTDVKTNETKNSDLQTHDKIMLEGLKVLFQCEGHNYAAKHCKLAVSLPPDKDL